MKSQASSAVRPAGRLASVVCGIAVLLLLDCRSKSSLVRSSKPFDESPSLSAADYRAFVRATNEFGLDLFQRLAEGGGNVFFSPPVVASMLGLVYAGARGSTAEQIAAAVGPRLPDSLFHVGMNRLALDLAARRIPKSKTADGEKSVDLTFARSVWAQESYAFATSYLETLSTRYDVGVNVIDFRRSPAAAAEAINAWVAAQTKAKVGRLLGGRTLDANTRLLFVGAVHFLASWEDSFDPLRTHPGTFHPLGGSAIDVPMMHAQRGNRYSEGDGYQALELPYYRQQLSMVIVLPAADRFMQIRARANAAWLDDVCARMRLEQLKIGIPRFALSLDPTSLKEPLKAMGVRDAFTENADFSGIEPKRELSVADIVQETRLDVTELGTEAASAAGALVAVSAADLPDTRSFEVDRSFLVFIRDRASGLVLFAGQILNPLN